MTNKQNGYKAFWGSRTTDIYADTSREAQLKAINHWRVPRRQHHMVHVHLCERADGTEVIHRPTE